MQTNVAERYQNMSDADLMRFAPQSSELTDEARGALVAELTQRGLKPPEMRKPARPDYTNMSHRQLMQVTEVFDDLTAENQEMLRQELSSRGVELDSAGSYEEDGGIPDGGEKLVTVARYRDMPEAIIARSVLESAGIQCFLRDENMVHMDWMMSNMIGGMRLQVEANDEEPARQLLAQPMPSSFPVDTESDFVQPTCPKCGSLRAVVDDTDRKIKGALTLTMLGWLPMVAAVPTLGSSGDGVLKCLNCGCKWYDDGLPENSSEESTPEAVG